MARPLEAVASRFDTDKAEHQYLPHYERRFAELREAPLTLLEIGIGGYDDPLSGGESLRMWRDYFPNATIVGLDIAVKAPIEGCHVEQGDQSDERVLNRLGETYGPFDIVIDDGSHRPDDVMRSWVTLWGHLASPGWYVIEDLQTSYWPTYGGSSVRTGESVMGFLMGLMDRIHYAEFDVPNYTPNRFDLSVVGLEIARNIAFIRKGDNSAPSMWMPPHPHGQVFEE